MSELINAQREAEGCVIHMGLDPKLAGSDALTKHLFETALVSILEFGPDTVAPTTVDHESRA